MSEITTSGWPDWASWALVAVVGGQHVESLDLEVDPEQLQDHRIVVDHENGQLAHPCMVPARASRPAGSNIEPGSPS